VDGEFRLGFRCAGSEDEEDVVFDGVLGADRFVAILIWKRNFVYRYSKSLMWKKTVMKKNETNDYCNKSFETITSSQTKERSKSSSRI
jgi:hypothetical protein